MSHCIEVRKRRGTYKSIASAFARLSICYDHGLLNISELFKELSEALICCVVGQASHKDLCESRILLLHPVCHSEKRGVVRGDD